MVKVNNPHLTLRYIAELNLTHETWHEATGNLSQEGFREIMDQIVAQVIANKPRFYLIDLRNMRFALNPETQEYVANTFQVEAKKSGLIRTAFIMPTGLVERLSIEQFTEEAHKVDKDVPNRYFDNWEQATAWLGVEYPENAVQA